MEYTLNELVVEFDLITYDEMFQMLTTDNPEYLEYVDEDDLKLLWASASHHAIRAIAIATGIVLESLNRRKPNYLNWRYRIYSRAGNWTETLFYILKQLKDPAQKIAKCRYRDMETSDQCQKWVLENLGWIANNLKMYNGAGPHQIHWQLIERGLRYEYLD